MPRRPIVPAELRTRPFTLVEAERAGLTWKQLQGRAWRRVGPAVYMWAGLTDGPELVLEAVQRRLPAGAAFSGLTAAWLHGLDVPPCDPVEVTIPDPRGISALTGVSIRRAALSESDLELRRGFPVTSALRTVVDLGRQLPLVDAVVAVDMALHEGLVTLTALQAHAAGQPARKGIGQLRRVIELAEPAAESPMETRLRLLLVLAGLPRPTAQVPLHDHRGSFVGRPDLYYPAQRLGLEYDGGTHRDNLVEDNRRQNRLLSAGFRLLRFTGADVMRTPDDVVRQVRDALASPPLNGQSGAGPPFGWPRNGRSAARPP